MDEDGRDGAGAGEGSALDFATYEDYLDSQISAVDMFYLEDEDLARDLVELGCVLTQHWADPLRDLPTPSLDCSYRGSGETLKREEFEARREAAEQASHTQLLCIGSRTRQSAQM